MLTESAMHDAALSRDLLLNELVRVLHTTFEARAAIVFRRIEDRLMPLCFSGCTLDGALGIAEIIDDENVGGDDLPLGMIGGRDQFLYRFCDDSEEFLVCAVEGQTALDRAEFEFLSMRVEFTQRRPS